MKIAIDTSPINDKSKISHRVRGVGFYINNLKEALLKYFPENDYTFFNDPSEIPPDTDIVHFPYFDPFFASLPINKKYKTVVTVHDMTPLVFPKQFPPGIKGQLKWKLQKYKLQKVDRIITDSNSSKKDIAKFARINEDKIDVVYLAAGGEFKRLKIEDLRFKKKDLSLKYNLPEKFVLYVGDVTWNKNLPRLVKAMSQLDIPLIMVGKALTEKDYDTQNPWNQDLVQTQKLISENKNVTALGFVPTEDLVTLYNLASLFAMPSIYEGFGLPILEAMRSGCPVITTRGGSLPEVAGDGAFYVNATDIDDIGLGIKKVFEDTLLQKELSEKDLKQANEFNWKTTAAETLNAYNKVLKS